VHLIFVSRLSWTWTNVTGLKTQPLVGVLSTIKGVWNSAQNTRRPISVVTSPRTTSRCGQRILKTLDSSTSAKTGSSTSSSVTSHGRVQRGSWSHGHTTTWAPQTITNHTSSTGFIGETCKSHWLIRSLCEYYDIWKLYVCRYEMNVF
jgi:hypothetical protein